MFFGWGFFLISSGSPQRHVCPHGAYVRRARRNRIDPHGGGIERLAALFDLLGRRRLPLLRGGRGRRQRRALAARPAVGRAAVGPCSRPCPGPRAVGASRGDDQQVIVPVGAAPAAHCAHCAGGRAPFRGVCGRAGRRRHRCRCTLCRCRRESAAEQHAGMRVVESLRLPEDPLLRRWVARGQGTRTCHDPFNCRSIAVGSLSGSFAPPRRPTPREGARAVKLASFLSFREKKRKAPPTRAVNR